jgi:hypothetical protein
MRIKQAVSGFILCLSTVYTLNPTDFRTRTPIWKDHRTVTEVDGDAIPELQLWSMGLILLIATVVANDNAFFMLNDLPPSISYHLTMAE